MKLLQRLSINNGPFRPVYLIPLYGYIKAWIDFKISPIEFYNLGMYNFIIIPFLIIHFFIHPLW
jgi:hypothetical protein